MTTSLELLSPAPSPPTLSSPSKSTSTASQLEAITLKIAEAVSQNDFSSSEISKYLVSDFVADFKATSDFQVPIQGREAYLDTWRKTKATRRMEVLSVSADVDEDSGRADVWLLLRVNDLARRDLSRESVTILSWRRDRGSWRCYKQSGMRGVSGFRI